MRAPAVQLERARQRIGVISLLFAVLFGLGTMSGLGWWWVGGTSMVQRYHGLFEVPSAILWALLALAVRLPVLDDRQVSRLGQGFLIAVCAAHGGITSLNALSDGTRLPMVTWATLWVAMWPLLVPAPPRETLAVVALAAAMAPLSLGAMDVGFVDAVVADYVAVSVAPVVAATIAVLGAELVHRSTVDVTELREHQALLDAVLGGVGDGLVLRGASGAVVFHNERAVELGLLEPAGALGEALTAGRAGLVTGPDGQSLLVAHHPVQLGGVPHRLLVVRPLTHELDQAEVDSWRELIRALSHELNNSLAPMSSTLYSVRQMIGRPEHADRLTRALDSLQRRTEHLSGFLEEYASLARLPRPRPEAVPWAPFVGGLVALVDVQAVDPLPEAPGWFDPGQLEQVLLNLVKNAEEAGSAPGTVELAVCPQDGGTLVEVRDRGQGLSDEALEQATLPFWSTRDGGTGLGLALARDIVVAHGGWLTLQRREGRGAVVRLWLPDRPQSPAG